MLELHWSAWAGFTLFILAMLALDLGVFHRKSHEVSLKEAAMWSVVWATLAMLFSVGIFYFRGSEVAVQFITGYLIELSLSADNIFVFALIFGYFAVPKGYQHRVLFWGILGALVLRVVFILAGSALLSRFDWIFYVLGVFLIFTGIKMAVSHGAEVEPEKNLLLRIARKVLPVTAGYEGDRFFVRRDGRLWATPLFLVLLLLESTDLVFAVDSIPAIFAVTTDPFIVYTSNVFAILGLRSMYFLLAGVIDKFRYLNFGLGAVLTFVGIKMTFHDYLHIPSNWSLLAIATMLGLSIAVSIWRNRRDEALAQALEQTGAGGP
jgi:tellurite resistance protein TerC